MAHPRGLNFYIVMYMEMLKTSSQELLHQIRQYVAWIIPMTRRFQFFQIKSLGSQMANPTGPLVSKN